MNYELKIIQDVSEKLINAGIPFMITGSVAMNYYVLPRMTRDIDIVIELSLAEASRFFDLFKDDYYISEDALKDSIKYYSMFNMINNQSVIKIDCIIRKDDEFHRNEFKRRKKKKISDFETFYVSLEDLILSKLLWAMDSHSEMQMNDIKNLLSGKYDLNYVQKWAKNLSVYDLYLECCHE